MKPQYLTINAVKIIALDTNEDMYNIQIRVGGTCTIEVTTDRPDDSAPSNSFTPPVNPNPPVWQAAPAPVANVTTLGPAPWAAIRLTPTGTATVVILQQGSSV